VLKSAAKQRSAELLADFENQLGSQFTFDQDEIWEKAHAAADRECRKRGRLLLPAVASWAYRPVSRRIGLARRRIILCYGAPWVDLRARLIERYGVANGQSDYRPQKSRE
jgi:hypothetical protein